MEGMEIISSIISELGYVELILLFGVIGGIAQFWYTKNKSNKIEVMKQINDYENELIKLGKDAPEGPNYYTQYRLIQFHKLYILNRIAYLKEQRLINNKTLNFFQFRFEIGFRAYDWANEMKMQTSDSELRSFLKLKDCFSDYAKNTEATQIQKYYLGKKNNNSKYNPYDDDTDPRTGKKYQKN
jgi:hypothetical protein